MGNLAFSNIQIAYLLYGNQMRVLEINIMCMNKIDVKFKYIVKIGVKSKLIIVP